MIASGGGESTREVLIRFKVEADTAGFRDVAKQAQTTQQIVTRAANGTSAAHAKAEKAKQRATADSAKQQAAAVRDAERAKREAQREQSREFEANIRQQAAASKKAQREALASAKAQTRAVAEAEREKRREQAATNRRTIGILKQQEREALAAEKIKAKAATARERAVRQADTAHQRATGKLRSANDQLSKSFNSSLTAAMRLGRGVAMLGLSGEKDMQKLLEGLIKIQVAMDVIGGAASLVKGLVTAWRAYREATLAAAAARATLTAAQKAGAAAETTGAVSGIAGVGGAGAIAGAGVAAGAATIWALISASDAIDQARKHGIGGGADPGSMTEIQANWYVDISKWTRKNTGFFLPRMGGGNTDDGFVHVIGRERNDLDALIEAEDKTARTQKRVQQGVRERSRMEQVETERLKHQRAIQTAGRFGRNFTVKELAGQLSTARDRVNTLRGQQAGGRQGLNPAIADAGQERLRLIQAMIGAEEKKRDVALAGIAAALRGEREKLGLLKQEEQQHLVNAQALRNQYKSGMERFGALDRASQAGLLRSKQMLEAGRGSELSREQLSKLGAYSDVQGIDKLLSPEMIRRARAGGGEQFIGQELTQMASLEKELARQVNVEAKMSTDVIVKMEVDAASMVEEVMKKVRALLEEFRVESQRVLQEAFDRERNERNLQHNTDDQTSFIRQSFEMIG